MNERAASILFGLIGNDNYNLDASKLAIGTVPLARISALTNTQIASGAAIAVNKLAALTASKGVVSDSNGFLASFTEVDYAAGANAYLSITSTSNSFTSRGFVAIQNGDTNAGPAFFGKRSRAALTTVASGDVLLSIFAFGHDGTSYVLPCGIQAVVAGAVSAGNVPTELRFYTGTTGTVQRHTINKDGNWIPTLDNTYDQGDTTHRNKNIYIGTSLHNGTVQLVSGTQGGAIADASGGAIQDAEARTALNTLLAELRTHGLIAT